MIVPDCDTIMTAQVRTTGRNWAKALEDRSDREVAFGFELTLSCGDEQATRLIRDGWWSAPERARMFGYSAPDLPGVWARLDWTKSPVGPQGRSRRQQVGRGEVKVWPGAKWLIRSAPKGSELPWEIRLESLLFMAASNDGGAVLRARTGLSAALAKEAALNGQTVYPEQSCTYPADDHVKWMLKDLYGRSGWIFLVLDAEKGRVLAVNELQEEGGGEDA